MKTARNIESKNRRRGAGRREGLIALPPQPTSMPANIIRGWDRNHPPTNGVRECARRLRQMNGRV